jgi:hypothetical protein
MPVGNSADSTTPAASVEPGPDVRLDNERPGHSPAPRATTSLDTPNRVWGRRDLVWRRDGDDWIICHPGSVPLFRVVRDTRFREMWRIAHAGDHLSDLANITRARDGAASRALAILNRPHAAQETPLAWPPIAQSERAAIQAAERLDRASEPARRLCDQPRPREATRARRSPRKQR